MSEKAKLLLQQIFVLNWVIDPLPCERQFLTIESPLKLMKNSFYIILKSFFLLEIFTFLSLLFGYLEKTALLNFKNL